MGKPDVRLQKSLTPNPLKKINISKAEYEQKYAGEAARREYK